MKSIIKKKVWKHLSSETDQGSEQIACRFYKGNLLRNYWQPMTLTVKGTHSASNQKDVRNVREYILKANSDQLTICGVADL